MMMYVEHTVSRGLFCELVPCPTLLLLVASYAPSATVPSLSKMPLCRENSLDMLMRDCCEWRMDRASGH